MSTKAVNDRMNYLKTNGWVATIAGMDPTTQEFVIARALFDPEGMQMAVARMTDSKTPHFWPRTLNDDTLKERLVYGSTPNDLRFDYTVWGRIPDDR